MANGIYVDELVIRFKEGKRSVRSFTTTTKAFFFSAQLKVIITTPKPRTLRPNNTPHH